MAEATITSKGQVTIPNSIRKLFDLRTKEKVIFIPDGDKVIMKPVKGNILDLRGVIKQRRGPIDFKRLREETKKKVVERIMEEMK